MGNELERCGSLSKLKSLGRGSRETRFKVKFREETRASQFNQHKHTGLHRFLTPSSSVFFCAARTSRLSKWRSPCSSLWYLYHVRGRLPSTRSFCLFSIAPDSSRRSTPIEAPPKSSASVETLFHRYPAPLASEDADPPQTFTRASSIIRPTNP
jgi:hypothetical protein